ncbi:Hypothetical predicted protein, partial [Pelobates cultripes]
MSQRQKSKAEKSDRAAFFLTKTAASKLREGQEPAQDGGDQERRENSPSRTPEEQPLTMG